MEQVSTVDEVFLKKCDEILENISKVRKIYVEKKDGTKEEFNKDKVITAINKAAERTLHKLKDLSVVNEILLDAYNLGKDTITVEEMHNIVEHNLEKTDPKIADSYRNYRNYKKDFVHMLDKVYQENQRIMYLGDKENSNIDSTLVSTKRSLVYNELSKELYKKFFLTVEELQAIREGYIYIHDMSARLNTMNCCLFNVSAVLKDGFEMGNIWYNEPKSLDVAFDVIGDIVMSASSQQYGGFTLPEVDKVLQKYAELSYEKYYNEYIEVGATSSTAYTSAMEKVKIDFEQGFQGWEYKFNTVASSRGDYPFITVTSGLSTTEFGKMCNIAMLKVRQNGQGKKGNKKPVLFPKIVFLYDKHLHGEGGPLYDIYKAGIECCKKAMYPDWLSLTGEGYVAEIYKKYGKVISPMGCRAFLSPWYERGGMKPADENDSPVFVGRFNIGAVSLHLPMILAKARKENRDFYEVLDYYLQLIRKLHKRTYDYLGELKASTNPLAYCEGGFYGGHLNYHDKIKPLLKSATASFGITALNELQRLYNGKSLVEDGQFAVEVMQYINKRVNEFKEEDGYLYALYGTPAESLCFAGNTVVQSYSGDKQIKDIKVGDLVYSLREDGRLDLNPVTDVKMTQKHAVVVKVLLDNKQEIICTPEHLFGVRKPTYKDGKFIGEKVHYIKAGDLKQGDRLKSNYRFLKCNRPAYSIYYNKNTQLEHDIVARYFYGEKQEGQVVHHINKDKSDNTKENLQYMSSSEHKRLHVVDNIYPYCYTSESQSGTNNAFYGKHHTAESNYRNRIAHIGKSIEVFNSNMEHVDHFDCADDAEKAGYVRHLVKLACCGERENNPHTYKGLYWYYTQDCELLEKNHKVVSVTVLPELIPVYSITVANNHNYFVGGSEGVLVHNCEKQVEQFRKLYGIIENVSDKLYVSNSFHCHVTENITPIEKQDLENRFWNLMNGGKIQYVKYPISYNTKAIETLVKRAMDLGFYEGVNLSLSYCDDCGYEQLDMDVCPKCGSRNLTKIDRMNGYLSYSRVKGDTRLNKGKMAEIHDRVSM